MRPVRERPLFPHIVPETPRGLLDFAGSLVRQLVEVLSEMAYRLNRTLPKDGSEAMGHPLPLATFTVATRPPAADWAGGVIYVSDASTGAKFQGSDGSAWVNLG
ncbi:MAG: hypothetical protein EA405_13655 [Rhodospirillales bacterium]|nr:MAG: hypothetical protein EA405_13655 [Rhodospirillales bacterium]